MTDTFMYRKGREDAENGIQERSDDASYLQGYYKTKEQLERQAKRFKISNEKGE